MNEGTSLISERRNAEIEEIPRNTTDSHTSIMSSESIMQNAYEYQNIRESAHLSKKIFWVKISVFCHSVAAILVASSLLLKGDQVKCSIPIHEWLKVLGFYYGFTALLHAVALAYLIVQRGNSIFLAFLDAMMWVFFVSWQIYGNTIFYSNQNDCLHGSEVDSKLIWNTMMISLIIGYFDLIKVAILCIVIVILIPVLICLVCLGAPLPQWTPTPASLIQTLNKS
jgi:hypothetical protein